VNVRTPQHNAMYETVKFEISPVERPPRYLLQAIWSDWSRANYSIG
jgi:hypothetical protein